MKNKPIYFLVSTGISLFSNLAKKEERDLLFRYANTQNPKDIPLKERQVLEGLINRVRQEMQSVDKAKARILSAELNSILAYYENLPQHHLAQDVWAFLLTDTYLAQEVFSILQEWIKKEFRRNIEEVKILDLNMENPEAMLLAFSDLVKKIIEIHQERQNHYHIVFNLTGGFKAILAFLQTLGQFYADEMIYLFEGSQNLMRIPRLPLKWEVENVITENFDTLRKLSLGLPVGEKELSKIPEILLFKLSGEVSLSPWGELVFDKIRRGLYQKKLYESPCEKIIFTESFHKSVEKLQPYHLSELNTRIDDLVRFHCGKGENPKRLDFKKLKGHHPKYTHEFDAWSFEDARRVFCRVEGDKIYLVELARGLH